MSLRYFSSDSEWESCRPLITELRQTPGMTLKQIQAHVESHCGLRATEKMYKNKFEKWSLGKNNRRGDIEAILRRKAQRDAAGKSTHFFLKGRLVRLADVDRYAKRNRISLGNLQPFEENESDDKDLICCTPPPASSMLQPKCYRETEKFFHSFFNFALAEVNELGKMSTSNTDAISHYYSRSMRAKANLNRRMVEGAHEYELGNLDLAGIYWRIGFAELDANIKDSQPDFILELLFATRHLAEAGCPEIGVMLRKHASQIADARLGANHPRLLAYGSMAAFEECEIQTILVIASKLHRRALAERYEESSQLMWDSRLWSANLLSRLGDHTVSTEFRSLLSEMENQLGKSDRRVLEVLLDFGTLLSGMSLYEEAETVFLDFLERDATNGPDHKIWEFQGLMWLGITQYKRGNVEATRTTFIAALSAFQRKQLGILGYAMYLKYAYRTLERIARETQRGDEAIEWDAKSAEIDECVRGYELAEGNDPRPCV